MAEFKGTIELIGGITPKNNGDFPLVTSKDIELPDGVRLSDIFVKANTASVREFIADRTITTSRVMQQYVYADNNFNDSILLGLWKSNWSRAIVTYDEQTHVCEPKIINSTKVIGNGALAGDSSQKSDEPFVMIVMDTGSLMIYCSEPGVHRIAVTLEFTDRYTIDNSYVPRTYELVAGSTHLDPDKYYVFGEVNELTVELNAVNDNKLHEHIFEFVPSDNFTSLTITPEPKWVSEIQIVPGKTHQVSIVRGIGVMACA